MNSLSLCEKYRPKKIEDFAFSEETSKFVKSLMKNHTKQNLMFYGKPGTGKTSISMFLSEYWGVLPSTLSINASKETGIDLIRDNITRFVQSSTLGCGFKLCVLSEADGLTRNAQQALKDILEESIKTQCYFIFTTNRPDKIIEEIVSRTIPKKIEPDVDSFLKIIESNLKKEDIVLDSDQKNYLLKYIYPDMRKAYNWVESGFLINDQTEEIATIIHSFLKKATSIEKLSTIRQKWINIVSSFDEYEKISEFLVTKFIEDKSIDQIKSLKIARSLNFTLNNYENRRDKELNFFCSIIDIYGILNE